MCPSCLIFMHHACLSSPGVLPAAEIEYRGGCDEDVLFGYDEFGDVSADLAEHYYIGDGICDDFNNNVFGSFDGAYTDVLTGGLFSMMISDVGLPGGDCCCSTCEDPSGSPGTCDTHGGCSNSKLCAGPIYIMDVTGGDTLAPTPSSLGCVNFDNDVIGYTGGYDCDDMMNSGQCELYFCSTCDMAGLCDASCGYCTASPSIAPSEGLQPSSLGPSPSCVDFDYMVMNYTGGYDCDAMANAAYCEPNFCPTCELAGLCDASCGYCGTRSASPTTSEEDNDVKWAHCMKFGSVSDVMTDCSLENILAGTETITYPSIAWQAFRDIVIYYETDKRWNMTRLPSLLCPDCKVYSGPYMSVPFGLSTSSIGNNVIGANTSDRVDQVWPTLVMPRDRYIGRNLVFLGPLLTQTRFASQQCDAKGSYLTAYFRQRGIRCPRSDESLNRSAFGVDPTFTSTSSLFRESNAEYSSFDSPFVIPRGFW